VLGSKLRLTTKAAKGEAYGLTVDWSLFERGGRELSSIPIRPLAGPAFSFRRPVAETTAETGTELLIHDLRQDWTPADMRALRDEISILTSPFTAAKDFTVTIDNDVDPGCNGEAHSTFLDSAEIDLTLRIDADGSIQYQSRSRDRRDSSGEGRSWHSIRWTELIQPNPSKPSAPPTRDAHQPTFGPATLRLLFYPRKADTIRDTRFSLKDLRAFLDKHAGIRVYRDNVRVRPYGDPAAAGGDWLGLGARKSRDPAGASRSTFRIAPGQLVGAVFVTRDKNPKLVDSSAREGLIEDNAFSDLRAFVLGGVLLLESQYHTLFKQRRDEDRGRSPTATVKLLSDELAALEGTLQGVTPHIPGQSDRALRKSLDQVSAALTRIRATRASLREWASQTTVYRGLASVGIAAAVFGHETQSAISSFLMASAAVARLLERDPDDVEEALEELYTARKFAEKIGTWGAFAMTRIARDKRRRRNVDIRQLVADLCFEVEPAFSAINLDFAPFARFAS